MPILANTRIWTARGPYTASAKQTGTPQPYLSGVLAALMPFKASSYTPLPTTTPNLLESEYVASVDPGTDIAAGDRLIKITLLDGLTPWPGEVGQNTNEFWQVIFAVEEAPGFLAERAVYIKRIRGSGPTHP